MMTSPSTVTLRLPSTDDEQPFLLQAVELAVKAIPGLPASSGKAFEEMSSTSTDQDIAVRPHFLESLPHRSIEFDS